MKKLSLTIFLILLSVNFYGCATTYSSGNLRFASSMSELSLGMSKAEVIKVIGIPDSTKADGVVEVLEYRLLADRYIPMTLNTYWVIFQNDKVIKYGLAGDFGTAKPATVRFEIDNLDK